MKNFNTLETKNINDTILLVSLNRPQVHNAMNTEMMKELGELWHSINADKTLRCVVITGSGEKSFCAGADLKERNNMTQEQWQAQHDHLEKAFIAMSNCAIPVIAAVNGYAFGGGLEMLLAADFAYASDNAIFSQSETKLGIMPGAMATQNFPKATGIRRAKELIFTGDAFNAQQALQWNIVNAVFTSEALVTEAIAVAEKIAANAPLAVQQVKKSLQASLHLDKQQAYAYELDCYNQLINTKDRQEGIAAFNEKRKANFVAE